MPSDTATAVTAAQVRLRVALGQARFDDALAIASAAAGDFGATRPVEASTLLGEARPPRFIKQISPRPNGSLSARWKSWNRQRSRAKPCRVALAGVLYVQGAYVRARELYSGVIGAVRLLASDQADEAAELLLDDPYKLQIGGWAGVATVHLRRARPGRIALRGNHAKGDGNRRTQGDAVRADGPRGYRHAGAPTGHWPGQHRAGARPRPEMGLLLETSLAASIAARIEAQAGNEAGCRQAVDFGYGRRLTWA